MNRWASQHPDHPDLSPQGIAEEVYARDLGAAPDPDDVPRDDEAPADQVDLDPRDPRAPRPGPATKCAACGLPLGLHYGNPPPAASRCVGFEPPAPPPLRESRMKPTGALALSMIRLLTTTGIEVSFTMGSRDPKIRLRRGGVVGSASVAWPIICEGDDDWDAAVCEALRAAASILGPL